MAPILQGGTGILRIGSKSPHFMVAWNSAKVKFSFRSLACAFLPFHWKGAQQDWCMNECKPEHEWRGYFGMQHQVMWFPCCTPLLLPVSSILKLDKCFIEKITFWAFRLCLPTCRTAKRKRQFYRINKAFLEATKSNELHCFPMQLNDVPQIARLPENEIALLNFRQPSSGQRTRKRGQGKKLAHCNSQVKQSNPKQSWTQPIMRNKRCYSYFLHSRQKPQREKQHRITASDAQSQFW